MKDNSSSSSSFLHLPVPLPHLLVVNVVVLFLVLFLLVLVLVVAVVVAVLLRFVLLSRLLESPSENVYAELVNLVSICVCKESQLWYIRMSISTEPALVRFESMKRSMCKSRNCSCVNL